MERAGRGRAAAGELTRFVSGFTGYPSLTRPRETQASRLRRMLRHTRAKDGMGPLLDATSAYRDAVTTVFSSPIAFKAWFASAAAVLAVVQVLTASRMWGKLQRVVPLSFPVAKQVHRWSGRLAILCTIPVFFHCVFLLGFQTPDARVAIHSEFLE